MARRRNTGSDQVQGGSFTVLFTSLSVILLAFFILLNTMAVIDEQKMIEALGSLMGSFGILEGEIVLNKGDSVQSLGELERFFKDKFGRERNPERVIGNYVSIYELQDYVIVEDLGSDLRITLREKLLFDLGKADLKNDLKPLLRIISILIKDRGFPTEIGGHTDNLPIHTMKYSSNWELSTARAINVLRYLVEVEKVDPFMVSGRGFGEYQPQYPNNSEENRMRNRRVVFLLKGGGSSGKGTGTFGDRRIF